MSPRLRIASISMASAAAIGLCVAVGVAPPAIAEPCQGAAAAAQPPATPAETPDLPSSSDRRPIGQRPRNANEGAPLPRLGQLPSRILSSLSPRSAQVQQQAAVAPSPTPPGAADQQPAAQPVPDAAPAPAPAPPSPPGTSLVGWVTGPDSPNNTIETIRHHRNRPRDHVGQRRSRNTSAHGLRRHLRLLRRPRQAMAIQHADAQPGRRAVQDRQRAEWRCRQPVLRLTAVGAPAFPSRSSTASNGRPTETGIIPTAGISVGGNQYLNFMSIKSWDANGAWTTNFSAIAVSPDNGERWGVYPDSVRTADRTPSQGPLRSGK